MISETFNSGNYNQWDHFVSTVLPAKNMILRQEIIPTIDNVFLQMLGSNAKIEKTSIDVEEICDRNSLKAIRYNIVYTVLDFKAPEAPKAAVEKDVQAISQAIFRNDFKLINVTIDINTGIVNIIYEANLVEE